MANKRRAANRRGGDLETKGAKSGWSGSPAHTERRGKHGGVSGAGELQMAGPGAAASRVRPAAPAMQEAAKGTPPKGMKTYREE